MAGPLSVEPTDEIELIASQAEDKTLDPDDYSNLPDPQRKEMRKERIAILGNLVKGFMGINVMAVAYGYSNAGIIRGTLIMIFIAVVTEKCCHLLLEVKHDITRSGSGPPPETYPDIANDIGGPTLERITNLLLVLTQFGFCVSYLIFIAQTLHDIFHSSAHVWMFVLVPMPIVLVLAFIRSVNALAPFSMLANISLLIGVISVLVYIIEHFHWIPTDPGWLKVPLFCGQMTAALEGIALVVPLENVMKYKKNFPGLLRWAFLIMVVILMVVGILGFATFGGNTKSIILLNIEGTVVITMIKSMLVIGILFTYPLQMVPVLQTLDSWLFGRSPPKINSHALEHEADALHFEMEEIASFPAMVDENMDGDKPRSQSALADDLVHVSLEAPTTTSSDPRDHGVSSPSSSEEPQLSFFVSDIRQILGRILIVMLSVLIAILAGASFGPFLSLIGSLGGSLLAYTLPGYIHQKAFGSKLPWWKQAINYCLIVLGTVMAVLGTLSSLKEIRDVHAGQTADSPK